VGVKRDLLRKSEILQKGEVIKPGKPWKTETGKIKMFWLYRAEAKASVLSGDLI